MRSPDIMYRVPTHHAGPNADHPTGSESDTVSSAGIQSGAGWVAPNAGGGIVYGNVPRSHDARVPGRYDHTGATGDANGVVPVPIPLTLAGRETGITTAGGRMYRGTQGSQQGEGVTAQMDPPVARRGSLGGPHSDWIPCVSPPVATSGFAARIEGGAHRAAAGVPAGIHAVREQSVVRNAISAPATMADLGPGGHGVHHHVPQPLGSVRGAGRHGNVGNDGEGDKWPFSPQTSRCVPMENVSLQSWSRPQSAPGRFRRTGAPLGSVNMEITTPRGGSRIVRTDRASNAHRLDNMDRRLVHEPRGAGSDDLDASCQSGLPMGMSLHEFDVARHRNASAQPRDVSSGSISSAGSPVTSCSSQASSGHGGVQRRRPQSRRGWHDQGREQWQVDTGVAEVAPSGASARDAVPGRVAMIYHRRHLIRRCSHCCEWCRP